MLDGELPEDCIVELGLFALLREAKRIAIKGTYAVNEALLDGRRPELRTRLERAIELLALPAASV